MPIFDFMKKITGSLGLAIALLTIFIRLIISPLTYKSYLSGAKMKALRPEIAKLKAKHGDDQAGDEYGSDETIQGGRCKSSWRMYSGFVTDPDILCSF